jgi:hypothetical protein
MTTESIDQADDTDEPRCGNCRNAIQNYWNGENLITCRVYEDLFSTDRERYGIDVKECWESVTKPEPDYVAVAERYFKKKCLPDEVVHHIDGDHSNNDPENLVIMKRSQHSRLHSGLMGALDKWLDRVNSGICNTCLFVSLFESMNISSRDVISDELSSLMLSVWIKDQAKPIPRGLDAREFLTSLNEQGIAWKKQHDHDCHSGKNMKIIVRGAK